MCSSRFFSLNSWSSTILHRRFFKKAKAVHLLNSRVRSGNRRRAGLKRRSHSWEEEDTKIVNMRLYLENKCIMEENNRLRKIALFLRQENRELQAHMQNIKKSSICTLQS